MTEKIVIIGGGMAGLTAAFELSDPDLADKFDITIYQMGWRLGGKCATGRNQSKHMRIEEHGIHAFAGSYYNALVMMKKTYDELNRPASHPLPNFETAFPKKRSSFMWDYHDNKMKKWVSYFPERPLNYSTAAELETLATEQSTLEHWVATVTKVLQFFIPKPPEISVTPSAKFITKFLDEVSVFENNLVRFEAGDFDAITIPPMWLETLETIDSDTIGPLIISNPGPGIPAIINPVEMPETQFFEKTDQSGLFILSQQDGTGRLLSPQADGVESITAGTDIAPLTAVDKGTWFSPPEDDGTIPWDLYKGMLRKTPRLPTTTDKDRRGLDRIEFLQVILRGVRDDNLEKEGFSKVDDEDFDAWLKRHGASPELMRSPLVTTTMFVTYQFPDGDLTRKPKMSASSFVQWILRTTSYLDAAYYLFEAGSGETLITPLHDVLKARGVKIELFHELTDIELNSDGTEAAKIDFNVQARSIGGNYDPHLRVKGLKVWPNEPLYDRLEAGEALKTVDLEAPNAIKGQHKSLKQGADFDKVILAIPPRAIEGSAPTLFNSAPAWKNLSKMAMTATQSMQLWLNKPIEELSLHSESFFVSGNYRSGLHGIAEFYDILQYEDWPAATPPKGLVYFSGVMTGQIRWAPYRCGIWLI